MLHHLFPKTENQKTTRERIGAISDYDKIAILKQKLYVNARHELPTNDLRRAIDCLQEGLDAERREKNSFNFQLSAFTNSLILSMILATGLSYAITKSCGDYSSHLCKDAHLIPDAIARYIK